MVQAWCPICFDQYGPATILRVFGCGHVSCGDCIPKLVKVGCPICSCDKSLTETSTSNFWEDNTVQALNERITRPVFVDFYDDPLQKKVHALEIAIELEGAKIVRSRREITSLKKELQRLQAAYSAKAIELDRRLESLQITEEKRVITVEGVLDYAEGLESIVSGILEQEPTQHADARRKLRGLRARLSQPILPKRRGSILRACVKFWHSFVAGIHTADVVFCVTFALFVAGYYLTMVPRSVRTYCEADLACILFLLTRNTLVCLVAILCIPRLFL